MHLPNYYEGCTVNLMSSLGKVIGSKLKTGYNPLKDLSIKYLKKYKNVVLIVLDGLGYEFLIKQKSSFLKNHLEKKLCSVFPPTTAAAATVFLTGLPAQQHGLTGWYVFLKEIGILTTILRFVPRISGFKLSDAGVNPKKIFLGKSLYSKTKVPCHVLYDDIVIDSDFTIAHSGNAKRSSYKAESVNSFFKKLKQLIKSNNKKKFISAYWPGFDAVSHGYGINSKKTKSHFLDLDKRFSKLADSLKGTDTIILITADHGLIDCPKSKQIDTKNHPAFEECLSMPLSGEPRLAYCYVKASKAKDFEKYVKKRLGHACWIYRSEALLNNHFFGLFEPHPKLKDRIGDYVLIMKENYVILDGLLGKKPDFPIGNHGGVSKDELYVPLIVLKC